MNRLCGRKHAAAHSGSLRWEDYDEKLGLAKIINAAGTYTNLTASIMPDSVQAAVARAAETPVRLVELRRRGKQQPVRWGRPGHEGSEGTDRLAPWPIYASGFPIGVTRNSPLPIFNGQNRAYITTYEGWRAREWRFRSGGEEQHRVRRGERPGQFAAAQPLTVA